MNARIGPAGVLLAGLLATFCLGQPTQTSAQDVVVNDSAGIAELDLHTLRSIFGMRLSEWPNGQRITVYVMDPDSETHNRFTKRRLKLFPYQLTQAWDRLVFSGTGQTPLQVDSNAEMVQRLINTPGAIGYLPRQNLPDGLLHVEILE